MAKAKTKAPKKKTPMKYLFKTFKGDLLQGKYDEDHLKRHNLLGRTKKRKLRYWCFRIRLSEVENKKHLLEGVPKGLKAFVEKLPGFAGWEYFAVSWDLHGENPFMVVLRIQSVWEQWDAVMNRVAIPIDAPPEQIHARIQALTDDYARRESGK